MIKSRVVEWWARAYVSWDCREVTGEGMRVVGSVAEWWAGACVVEWGRGRQEYRGVEGMSLPGRRIGTMIERNVVGSTRMKYRQSHEKGGVA